MVRWIEAEVSASGLSFGLVVARFNEQVTERLAVGALDCLKRHGADPARITAARVPGSFELPLSVQLMARSGRFDAILALGCLVRGATPHFDVLAASVSSALGTVALHSEVPVSFGVLTCDSFEQAVERSGGKAGNKGWDVALVAIEMARMVRLLRAEAGRPAAGT